MLHTRHNRVKQLLAIPLSSEFFAHDIRTSESKPVAIFFHCHMQPIGLPFNSPTIPAVGSQAMKHPASCKPGPQASLTMAFYNDTFELLFCLNEPNFELLRARQACIEFCIEFVRNTKQPVSSSFIECVTSGTGRGQCEVTDRTANSKAASREEGHSTVVARNRESF